MITGSSVAVIEFLIFWKRSHILEAHVMFWEHNKNGMHCQLSKITKYIFILQLKFHFRMIMTLNSFPLTGFLVSVNFVYVSVVSFMHAFVVCFVHVNFTFEWERWVNCIQLSFIRRHLGTTVLRTFTQLLTADVQFSLWSIIFPWYDLKVRLDIQVHVWIWLIQLSC